MRIVRRLLIASTSAAVAGCAMAPLAPTTDLNVNRPGKDVALLLESQARKCWSRRSSMSQDGISVDARRSIAGSYVISAARFARDIGLREPFFVVEVSEDKNGATSVSTREGDYACSLLGSCYSLNYTGDVKRWLNGDSSCGNPIEPII